MLGSQKRLVLGHGVQAEVDVFLGIEGYADEIGDNATKNHRGAKDVVSPNLAELVGNEDVVRDIGPVQAALLGGFGVGC